MKHTAAIAALVVASIGLTALPAFAQDTTPVARKADREVHRTIFRDAGPGRGAGGILGLVCSPNGAEALEISFVRLSHRITLTDTQQPLFDALKAKALTTQTSFADTCESATPAVAADAKPDVLQSLKSRLAVEEARLEAMNAILPDFEAFYGSLTDEQKAGLFMRMGPGGRDHGDRVGRSSGADRNAPGRTYRMPAPGR